MSSIIITSRLHSAWRQSTKQWAREMHRVSGPESGFTSVAPRPSQSEPPPEEFGTVLRALLPFINHGVNNVTASAILSASTATVGVPANALLPLAYYSGVTVGTNGVALGYPRDWVGCPLVPMEPFPMSSLFRADEVPGTIASFPTESIGQILFSAYRGVNLWPRTFSCIADLSEAELAEVHQRELERVPALPGVYIKPVITSLRYAGCVRPATDAEIDALFVNRIRVDCWLKSNEFSFRDFFGNVGINESILSEALTLSDSVLRAATAPAASTPTDVPTHVRAGRTSRSAAEGRPASPMSAATRRRLTDIEATAIARTTAPSPMPEPSIWHNIVSTDTVQIAPPSAPVGIRFSSVSSDEFEEEDRASEPPQPRLPNPSPSNISL